MFRGSLGALAQNVGGKQIRWPLTQILDCAVVAVKYSINYLIDSYYLFYYIKVQTTNLHSLYTEDGALCINASCYGQRIYNRSLWMCHLVTLATAPPVSCARTSPASHPHYNHNDLTSHTFAPQNITCMLAPGVSHGLFFVLCTKTFTTLLYMHCNISGDLFHLFFFLSF